MMVDDDELTQILRRELAPIRDDLASLRRDVGKIRRDVATMGPQVAGIPFIHRAVETLRQESRQIKVAVKG